MRWTIVASTTVVALGLAGGIPAPAAVTAAPAQQGALTCAWQNAGNSASNLVGAASGYFGSKNEIWAYGGYDDSASLNNQSTNRVDQSTMSGAVGNPRVTSRAVSASGAAEVFGAACALRDKGADSDDTALYCIGGVQEPFDDGQGMGTVQRYMTKAGRWESNVSVQGTFTARYGAAAEYDPVHDVIWVTGGVQSCKLQDLAEGNACQARPVATMYLSFDPATGPKWNNLGSNESTFFHTMVYDSMGKRMIIQGGTLNGQNGQGTLKQLDLSTGLATASMKTLSATGSGPSALMHGAAYDSDLNMMVTYGGVTRNFLTSREATENRAMALDLSGATAAWVNLNATIQDRVGIVMEYDTKQKATILLLGRKVFDGDAMTPFKATTQRSAHGLVCSRTAVTPTTPATPTTPTTPGTPTTVTPTTPPTTPPPPPPEVCESVKNKVPSAVLSAAAAAPQTVQGWDQLCNPNLPQSPFNVKRNRLTLQDEGKRYHPLFNSLVWKCGCH